MSRIYYTTTAALALMFRHTSVIISSVGYENLQYRSAVDGRIMARTVSPGSSTTWGPVEFRTTLFNNDDPSKKWFLVTESDHTKPESKPEPPKEPSDPRNAAWVAFQDAIDDADGEFSPKTLRRLFALFGKYIDARMARHYVRSDDGFGAMEKKLAEQQDQINTLKFRIGKLEPEELDLEDDVDFDEDDDRDEY